MEIIQLYPFLKNGEIWQDIKQELDDLNVKPTGDDAHWMESCIEEAFDCLNRQVRLQRASIHRTEALYFALLRVTQNAVIFQVVTQLCH